MNDDLLNDFLLESFPNPDRNGCPDDETLKAFAEDRLPPGSSVLTHIASCSECYREYRHYRQDWKDSESKDVPNEKPAPWSEPIPISVMKSPERQSRPFLAWAFAAGLVAILGSGVLYLTHGHHNPVPAGALVASSTGTVKANVDLFDAVTTRGSGNESTPLEQVSLPSSVVDLAVTLPRFSQSGPYEVLVAKDRAGKDIVAHGTGTAVKSDNKVSLVVTLDLRNAAPGAYFLATVRGSDNGTYYYPLQVR